VEAIANTSAPLAAADLNDDGKLDLVVNSGLGPMGIYLGNGDGTFSNPATATYLGGVVAIADFNGDGKMDLVVWGSVPAASRGAVLLGNGDGTFQGIPDTPLPFSLNSGTAVLVGDFENSGFPDVAVSSPSYLYIFHNHAGTLSLSHTYNNVGEPIATGDFNSDGNLDLITSNGVMLGNGDGSFQAPIFYLPGATIVADFNNDKKLDTAATISKDSFEVSLGNGDGTFEPPLTMPLLNGAGIAAAADFNGDGKLDIAAGGILFGNGDGTFQDEVSIPNWDGTSFIADFNNDGKPDLVDGKGQVALGNGDGTFTVLPGPPLYTQVVTAVADVNGDGKPDMLVYQYIDSLVTATGFLLGRGDGTFGPVIQVPTNGMLPIGRTDPLYPTNIALVADMNGDGRPDIVFVVDGISVMLNTTPPGFEVLATALSPATVTPGNSATSTVTVSPMFGFHQAVTLTCTGMPRGATCAFSPATITNSSGTSALTITTSASLAAGTYSVQVQGTSGSIVNSVLDSLVVQAAPDFSVGAASGSPTSQTISAGQTASFSLALAGTGSFTGTVNLSCAITPAATPAPTCSLSSSSVHISGNATQTMTVKVGTTAPVSGTTAPHANFPSGPLPLVWALMFLGSVWFWARNHKRLPVLAAPIVVLAFAFSVGCGGSSTHTTPGTPAGTYTATVTATSGSTSHNVALQVIVQ